MRFNMMKILTLLIGLAFIGAVQAATVTFTLNIDTDAKTFEVLATASAGDNDGISAYGVPLTGNILTIDHTSPNATSNVGSPFPGEDVGFTDFRSPDTIVSLTINAAQVTVPTPTPFPVFGFGQSAGSLTAVATDVIFDEQDSYGAPLQLATGTFGTTLPGFDVGNPDLAANTFDDMNGVNPVAESVATIMTVIVPEPGSVALVALGGLLLIFRRQRRHG